jgi:hypothetical protein
MDINMKLTEDKVKLLYEKYLCKANREFVKGNYSKCLTFLKVTAYTGYYFYLGYKDENLESLLIGLSNKIKQADNFTSTPSNRFIFYDSFSIDNGGLVQQYLSALISIKHEIIYITERKDFMQRSSAIRTLLEEYGKAIVKVVPTELSEFAKAQFVYDSILLSNSDKLLIHTKPDSISANVAFYAISSKIMRYKINITDHTFWVGAGCLDYSFEFRPFGCTLSALERGVSKDHIFYMPFYPIMNKKQFDGYPKEADGNVVLFSGGAYYKIYDKDDTYFRIVKSILDNCPNVILLYAGIGDSQKMKLKIAEYNMQNRFILLGQRSDITEVFEHCDIYLNTYPFGGGLMSQYAAQLGKPIVNYYTPDTAKVEEFVCQRSFIELSDSSIEGLTARVKDLSESEEARKSLGQRIKACVITPDVFNDKFKSCIETKKNQMPYVDTSLKEHFMDIKDKLFFDAESKEYAREISKIFRISTIYREPLLFFDAVRCLFKGNRLIKAVKNNYKYRL